MDPNEMVYITLYASIEEDASYSTVSKEQALLKLKESFLWLFEYAMQTEPDPS